MIFEGLDDRLWMHPDITNIAPKDDNNAWVIKVNRMHNFDDPALVLGRKGTTQELHDGVLGEKMPGTMHDKIAAAAALSNYARHPNSWWRTTAAAMGVPSKKIAGMVKCRDAIDVTLGVWTWDRQKIRSIAHWVDLGLRGIEPEWVPQSSATTELAQQFLCTSGFRLDVIQEFARQCSERRGCRRRISNNIKWLHDRVPFVTPDGLLYVPTDRPFMSMWSVHPQGWESLTLKVTSTLPPGYIPLAYAPPAVVGRVVRSNAERIMT